VSEYRVCDFWNLEQYITCLTCDNGNLEIYDLNVDTVVNLLCNNCGQKVNLHYNMKVEVTA
jgi:transcription elongation factor Elf1